MLKIMQKCGVILSFFTAVLTGLTVLLNELIKSTIDEQIIKQQQALFDQVIPADFYDNELYKSCYIVQAPQLGRGEHHLYIARRNGTPVGAVMEVTVSDRYSSGGAMQLLVSSDFSGAILGTHVVKHHKIPNLRNEIRFYQSDCILHPSEEVIQRSNDPVFVIKEDGDAFDQFTSVTTAPRAVVNAVRHAGLYAKTLSTQLSTLPTCKD